MRMKEFEMMRRNKNMHKAMRLLISFAVIFLLGGASIICAQDQQKLLDSDFLHQLFFSAKDGSSNKETLLKKINPLAKESFDQQYKENVKNIELEGIYELAKNCYVTCHTAQLISGEDVFLFDAHIFGKIDNSDIQIHGRGKEDMAEFGKFMMMSESGKIKFIRYFFKTYARTELPS
jgi:hypothetical protein